MIKRGEIDFSVLLAIIIGAAILVFAIYGAVKIGGERDYQSNTEAAKELQNLMNPLQAGFADALKNEVRFNSVIDFRSRCDNFTGLGTSAISLRTHVSKGEPKEYGVPVKSSHYIFSPEEFSTQTIYTFSSSFRLPYDIADYILLIPEGNKYCFEDAPGELKSFLEPLNYSMFYFEDCSDNIVDYFQIVEGSGPGIKIVGECVGLTCESAYDYGYVEKMSGERVYYSWELLLPAILSDSSIYNCVLDRLFERAEILTEVYSSKASLMNGRGCTNSMGSNLRYFKGEIESREFIDCFEMSYELERLNMESNCRVW